MSRSKWIALGQKEKNMMAKSTILLALSLLVWPALSPAAEVHLSPAGDDRSPGTVERPLRSLNAAKEAARRLKSTSNGPITVLLHSGTYELPSTFVLNADDSVTKDSPIVYASAPGEEAVISGGLTLKLDWEPFRGGIFRARVPEKLATDQIFVDGERLHMARYPNFDPSAKYFGGSSADAFARERAARWADPRGGFVHAMHGHLWGDFHYAITGKDAEGNVTLEGGWQNNRRMRMHDSIRFVENVFEELDSPGEWFLDGKSRTLYIDPPAGVDLRSARVEAVRLRHLVEIKGTSERRVRFVTLKDLTFRLAARTFMDTREPLLRSDWTIYRGGAIVFDGAEDCALEGATIDQVGGNAVFVNDYNRRVAIRGCRISRAGANGVAFVGDPKAVRSPLFEYGERKDFREVDKTPGPRTNKYPADCLVEDCLIERSGRFEKQTAPIQISMAQDITIRHCSIYDVPRAGINISEGTWGGHVVEFCDVFDTVKETGDHGSFNSWGRDRYWGLTGVDLDTVTLGERRRLPLLDVVKPITLRNNRWRCDHGWDVDLDDGSTNYRIVNNLFLNGGLKLREGFYRVVENNVIVNNSLHPHVWYQNSQDVFRRNIVFTPYRPIGMKGAWGKEVDFNLLHAAGRRTPATATQLHDQSGDDEHSIVADALFVDPAHGDYQVKDGSPALKFGFENFPMDQFGVQSPRLKALARTPEWPVPMNPASEGARAGRDARPTSWLGATLREVVGAGEVSAAGLPGEVGVRVEAVSPNGAALKAGLRPNDVILKLDGLPTDSIPDYLRAWRSAAGPRVTLDLWRDQKPSKVAIERGEQIVFAPATARFQGPAPHPTFDAERDYLGSWTNRASWLEWSLPVHRAGEYEVEITLASAEAEGSDEFTLQVGDRTLAGRVPATGGWERFATIPLGRVHFDRPGDLAIMLRPARGSGAVMNLRSIELRPAGATEETRR